MGKINVDVNVNVDVVDLVLTELEVAAVREFVGNGGLKTPQLHKLKGYPNVIAIEEATKEIMEKYTDVVKDEITMDVSNQLVDDVPTQVFSLQFYVDVNFESDLARAISVELDRKKRKTEQFLKIQKEYTGK